MADAKDSIVLDLDLIPGKIEGKEVLKSVFNELSKLAEAVEMRSWNAEAKVSVKANKKVLEQSLAETVGLFKSRLEHATGDAADSYKAFVKHLENVLKTEAKDFGSDIPSFFQKVKNKDEEALKKLVNDPQYEKELKRYAAFVDRTNKQYAKILNRAADPLRQIFREDKEANEGAEFQLPLAFPGLDAAIKQSDSDLKDVKQILRNKEKVLEAIKTDRAKSRYIKERTARIDENDIKALTTKSKEFDFAGLRAAIDEELREARKALKSVDLDEQALSELKNRIGGLVQKRQAVVDRQNSLRGSTLTNSVDVLLSRVVERNNKIRGLRGEKSVEQLTDTEKRSIAKLLSANSTDNYQLWLKQNKPEDKEAAWKNWQEALGALSSFDGEKSGLVKDRKVSRDTAKDISRRLKALQTTIIKTKQPAEILQSLETFAVDWKDLEGTTARLGIASKLLVSARAGAISSGQGDLAVRVEKRILELGKLRQQLERAQEGGVKQLEAAKRKFEAEQAKVISSVGKGKLDPRSEADRGVMQLTGRGSSEVQALRDYYLTGKLPDRSQEKQLKDAKDAFKQQENRYRNTLYKTKARSEALSDLQKTGKEIAKLEDSLSKTAADKFGVEQRLRNLETLQLKQDLQRTKDALASRLAQFSDAKKRSNAVGAAKTAAAQIAAFEARLGIAASDPQALIDGELQRLKRDQALGAKLFSSAELFTQYKDLQAAIQSGAASKEEQRLARRLLGRAHAAQVNLSIDPTLTGEQRSAAKQAATDLLQEQKALNALITAKTKDAAATDKQRKAAEELADASEKLAAAQERIQKYAKSRGRRFTAAVTAARKQAQRIDRAADTLSQFAWSEDMLTEELALLDDQRKAGQDAQKKAKEQKAKLDRFNKAQVRLQNAINFRQAKSQVAAAGRKTLLDQYLGGDIAPAENNLAQLELARSELNSAILAARKVDREEARRLITAAKRLNKQIAQVKVLQPAAGLPADQAPYIQAFGARLQALRGQAAAAFRVPVTDKLDLKSFNRDHVNPLRQALGALRREFQDLVPDETLREITAVHQALDRMQKRAKDLLPENVKKQQEAGAKQAAHIAQVGAGKRYYEEVGIPYLRPEQYEATLAYVTHMLQATKKELATLPPEMEKRRQQLESAQLKYTREQKALQQDVLGNVSLLRQVGTAINSFMRYAVVYGSLYQLSAAFGSLVRNVVNFQDSLKQIQAIAQATDGQMVRLASAIRAVASTSPYNMQELAASAQTLAQAGIDIQKLPSALRAVSQMAAATGGDTNTAADILTSAQKIFPKLSDQQIADQVTRTVNISKLNPNDLQTLFNLAAQTAAASGVKSQQLLGTAATLSNMGIKGSTIATGLRQLLQELFSPDNQLTQFYRSRYAAIGEPQMNDAAIRTKFAGFQKTEDPMGAAFAEMKRLGIGAGGPAADQFRRIMETRAENVGLPLLKLLDVLEENIKRVTDSVGAAAEGAATRGDTLLKALGNLGDELESTADILGEGLLKSLKELAQAGTEAVRSIRTEIDARKAKGESITPNIAPTVAATLGAAMASPTKGLGRLVFGAIGGAVAGLSTTAAEGVGPVFSAITNWLITLLSITQILKSGTAKAINEKIGDGGGLVSKLKSYFVDPLGKLVDVVTDLPKLFKAGGLARLGVLVTGLRTALLSNPLGMLLTAGSLALELFDLFKKASPEDRLAALQRQVAALEAGITEASSKAERAQLDKVRADASRTELEVALAKPGGLEAQKKAIDELAGKAPSRENLAQLRQYRDSAARIMMSGGDLAGPASTLQGYIQSKMDGYIDNLTKIEAASKERADAEQKAAADSAARLQELTAKEAALQERRIALMQNEEADNAKRREIAKRINDKEDKNALLEVVRSGGLLDQRAAMERDKLAIDAEQAKIKFEVKAVENRVDPNDLRQVVHSNNPEVLSAYETYKAAQEKLRDLANQTEDERQRIMRGMRPDAYEPSPEAKKALDRAREIESELYDERLETEERLQELFDEWKRIKLFLANEELEHVKAHKDQFNPLKPEDFRNTLSELEEKRDNSIKEISKRHGEKLKQVLDQRNALELQEIERERSRLLKLMQSRSSGLGDTRSAVMSVEGRAMPVEGSMIRRKPNASVGVVGSAQGHMEGVDPDLLAAVQEAAHYVESQVQITSAVNSRRKTGNHPVGNALDIQLIKAGKVLPNLQNAQSFRDYEEFWQIVKAIMTVRHPGKPFRFGGYFSNNKNSTWGDQMHGDVTSNATAWGDWETGAYQILRDKLPGMQSKGMGDIATFAARLEGLTGPAPRSTISPNAQEAVRFFMSKGLSQVQAAGVVGHLMQESTPNLNPNAEKDGAYGIAQWTETRRKALEQRADFNTLQGQLAFAWEEWTTSEAPALKQLLAAKTVEDAVLAGGAFERANPKKANMPKRLAYAQSLLSSSGTEDIAGMLRALEARRAEILGRKARYSGNPDEVLREAADQTALNMQENLSKEAQARTDEQRNRVRNKRIELEAIDLQGIPYGAEAAGARETAGMGPAPELAMVRLQALETALLGMIAEIGAAQADMDNALAGAEAGKARIGSLMQQPGLTDNERTKLQGEYDGYDAQVREYKALQLEMDRDLGEAKRMLGVNRQEQQVQRPTLSSPTNAYGQLDQATDLGALAAEVNNLSYSFNKLGKNIRDFAVNVLDTFISTLADSIINGAEKVDTAALQEAQTALRDAQAEAAYQQATKTEEIRRLQQEIDAEGIDSAAAKRRKAELEQALNESIDARNQAITSMNEQVRQQQLASEQNALGSAMENVAKEGGSTLLKTAMLYPFQKVLNAFGLGERGSSEQNPLYVKNVDSKDPKGLVDGASSLFDSIFSGSGKGSESSGVMDVLYKVGGFFGGFFADGGQVKGPGTGTSDSIPAWLSNGEYVLTAKEVQAIGLQNIERWKEAMKAPAKFATGGLVGTFDRASSNMTQSPFGGGDTVVNVIDQRSAATSSPIETQRRQGPDGKEMLDIMVRDAVKKAINSGQLDRAMVANYGARRVGGAR